MSGPIAVSLGMSSVANTKPPTAADESKALELPDHQLRGELRIRIFDRGEFALVHEHALGHATKIDETQADVEGQPWSAGAAWRYSIHPEGAPWSVGIDTELLHWNVPYTEIRQCVENCEGVDAFQEIHGKSSELTFGFGVTPAYRTGPWTVYGGVYFRNHPTIMRKGTELTESNDEDTEAGPTNTLLHAGVAYQAGAFQALISVNQNLDRDPVLYGPGIGFALAATIDPGSGGPPTPGGDSETMQEARARMMRARARREARR